MCSQLPNCVCDGEDPRPVEYRNERKRAIYKKLAEEGGGTWAAYMMIEIEQAYADTILEESETLDGTVMQTVRLHDGTETVRTAPQPS